MLATPTCPAHNANARKLRLSKKKGKPLPIATGPTLNDRSAAIAFCNRSRWAALLVFAALAAAVVPFTATAEGRTEPEREWRPEYDEGRPHHLSLLLGSTTLQDEATAFTLGLDYEYRLNRTFGLGAVAEYAVQDVGSFTLLAVADIHVWRNLAVQLGPGIEFIDIEAEIEEHSEQGEAGGGEQLEQFVFRAGLLYEFEFETFTFSPQLHFDVVPGSEPDSYVVAFAFGRAF
jgi:hypothetical protein